MQYSGGSRVSGVLRTNRTISGNFAIDTTNGQGGGVKSSPGMDPWE
jgi:hypothetical protein